MPRRKPTEDEFARQVGARIRDLRLERNLSLRRVAEVGGCSVDGLKEIELGRSKIGTRTLIRIAQGIGVQLFDLLNTQNDDVGYVIEQMRRRPECVAFVRKACVSAAVG